FVMETLVDELAERARADPFTYRRSLLKPDARKLRETLDLLEKSSGSWRQALGKDHAIGVALHQSFGTGVGCVVDVSIENGRPRLHRATAAVHVGLPVNPLTIESQVQGGLVFGISQLMANGAITLGDGIVNQSNFHDFTPPYMRDAPVAVDVHIVPSV